jgi:hypothetical protein
MSFLLVSIALVTAAFAQLPSEGKKHGISKKELKVLLSTAKTAEDHQELADYFAQQAREFQRKSREYEVHCAEVAKYPMNYKTKYPSEYDHCRFWAERYELQSKEAESKVKLHEQLAKELTQKQQ